MSVATCKEEVDSREFETWKLFFHHGENGPRTQSDEIIDSLLGRQLVATINATGPKWPVEMKDVLLFPSEGMDNQEARIENAKTKLRGLLSFLKNPVAKVKHV